ncbi:MAG: cysteine desulfurase family protein [Thermodesulfobacteriota bacterium]
MELINFDHMSANPLLPEVQEAMIAAIRANYGNPSSPHSAGEAAAAVLDKCRETVAMLINAQGREIVFTSCGTESVNLAVKGLAWARQDRGKHIVTCNVEHNAVIRSLRRLKQMGFTITSVPVDEYGRVNVNTLAKAVRDDTILISIMHGNNEIGTIQPVSEIAAIAKERKVAFHVDAVDSVGVVPIDVETLGADLVSFASNPYYGPTGVGGLYVKKGTQLWSLLDGGIQENRRRAGTENLIGIVGMAKAAELAMADMETRTAHYRKLRELLLTELPHYVEDYIINGHPTHCLPNLVSVAVRHVEGESVVLMLDELGIEVSTRSACASGSLRASHVLLSTGLGFADCQGTLVLTFGVDNTEEQVMRFLAALKDVVGTLRSISPLVKK